MSTHLQFIVVILATVLLAVLLPVFSPSTLSWVFSICLGIVAVLSMVVATMDYKRQKEQEMEEEMEAFAHFVLAVNRASQVCKQAGVYNGIN